MERDHNNSRVVDNDEHDDTIDVSEAAVIKSTRSRGFSFLAKQNESDMNLSRSLLDTGELDSAFYEPPTI